MRRYSLFLVPVLALAANGFVAGCSGDDKVTPNDGGSDAPVVKKDAGPTDSGQKDSPSPPQVVTPKGKQLFPSNLVQVFGVTSDNLVIFADIAGGGALYAVDATGASAAVMIAAPTVSAAATYVAGVSGNVVFLWEGVDPKATEEVGKLSTWTKAGGLHQITLKSNASAGVAATTDGAKILYTLNADATGSTGDIAGAKVDGTAATTLAPGVAIGSTYCPPVIGFAGGVNPVIATCAPLAADAGVVDGGPPPTATVQSFDTNWAATALSFSGFSFWSSNSAGDQLLLASAAGVFVSPTAGGSAPASIDTKDISNGGFGYMEQNGQNVLYATAAGDLWTSPTSSPAPLALEASGVKYFRSVSPDEKYMIYTTTLDSQKFGGDLYLQSTSAATKTTLVSTQKGALFGLNSADDFTADSKYVLWIDNVNTSTDTGDLMVAPVGGTGTKLASDEWLNLSAKGSKIVFNDNCQGCGTDKNNQVVGAADIKSVDVSASTPTPTLLQAAADPQIYMAATKDYVIFTYSTNPAADDGGVLANGNGLYAIQIP